MHCTLNRAAIGALKHQFIKEASQHQQLLQPCSNRRPARISHFVPRDSVRLCKKRTVLLMLFAACCSGMWWNFHRKRWKKAANINFMNHYLHLSFNHSHLAICFDTCLHACERSNLHCERSSFIWTMIFRIFSSISMRCHTNKCAPYHDCRAHITLYLHTFSQPANGFCVLMLNCLWYNWHLASHCGIFASTLLFFRILEWNWSHTTNVIGWSVIAILCFWGGSYVSYWSIAVYLTIYRLCNFVPPRRCNGCRWCCEKNVSVFWCSSVPVLGAPSWMLKC